MSSLFLRSCAFLLKLRMVQNPLKMNFQHFNTDTCVNTKLKCLKNKLRPPHLPINWYKYKFIMTCHSYVLIIKYLIHLSFPIRKFGLRNYSYSKKKKRKEKEIIKKKLYKEPWNIFKNKKIQDVSVSHM